MKDNDLLVFTFCQRQASHDELGNIPHQLIIKGELQKNTIVLKSKMPENKISISAKLPVQTRKRLLHSLILYKFINKPTPSSVKVGQMNFGPDFAYI